MLAPTNENEPRCEVLLNTISNNNLPKRMKYVLFDKNSMVEKFCKTKNLKTIFLFSINKIVTTRTTK